MSAVGHYLEEEGIPTVSISLIREHTEAMRPPRALWVPFMLGRPLGAPNQPEFQRRVLHSALKLLEIPEGPVVMRDFPEDAPAEAAEPEDPSAPACPLSWNTPAPDPATPAGLRAALLEEIGQLQTWHDIGVQRRRGSSFGLTELGITALADELLSTLARLEETPADGTPGVEPRRIKLGCDDLRTWYEEAAAAQPGGRDSREVLDWYYDRTVAGRLVRRLREQALRSTDPGLRALGPTALLPRVVLNR